MKKNEMPLGHGVLAIQEAFGVTSDGMADLLSISHLEMRYIEENLSFFTESLRFRFEEFFGIDVYIATVCLTGKITQDDPASLRNAAARLYAVWDQMLAEAVEKFKASRQP